MEIRELRAFVAVVEEGGLSAAARRLHMSQSALSQTVRSLERRLGAQLLVRHHAGVRATPAGEALLREARMLVAHHDEALTRLAAVTGSAPATSGPLRVGVPVEFPPDLLPAALAQLARDHPDTRVEVRHASSTTQLAWLHAGDLDLALVRDRPADPRLDAVLAVREPLGVVLSVQRADEIAGAAAVGLEALAELDWVRFPRSSTPVWYDQVTAILRGHGVRVSDPPAEPEDGVVTAEVKLAAVRTGHAFALAPPGWSHPLPDGIAWRPLLGDPIVRRTWAVWRASARGRELAALVTGLELTQ